MIDRSPANTAQSLLNESNAPPPEELRVRAQNVIEKLGSSTDAQGNMAFWNELADTNSKVGTTLKALGVSTTAKLLLHGYVSAMTNMHIHCNYPLLDIPSQLQMEEFIRGE